MLGAIKPEEKKYVIHISHSNCNIGGNRGRGLAGTKPPPKV